MDRERRRCASAFGRKLAARWHLDRGSARHGRCAGMLTPAGQFESRGLRLCDAEGGRMNVAAEGGSPGSVRRIVVWLGAGLIAACGLVFSANHFLVDRPIQLKLAADSRNTGFSLSAHYGFYLDVSTLVLDLKAVDSASPADLFRALMQVAVATYEDQRRFSSIVLARSGRPVFEIDGAAFTELGSEHFHGENPVYLLRTLPEKLRRPNEGPAFGSWSGGLLGVTAKQMQDLAAAGKEWAEAP